ncbi:MAG: prolyl oligopeptidase family serine peptidase [Burkholderiales bacterium]|nr:prolyl oligopeptidase family serine peptidase [Burkholderiales bacterium]
MKFTKLPFAAGLAAAFALSSACAQLQAPAASAAADVVTPNANLHIEGIPPIAKSLAERVARYNDFRGHSFLLWHPKRNEMLVSHRAAGASTNQLYWLAAPMGDLQPVTRHGDPINGATIEPVDGRFIVFTASRGGSEAFQLFRQDKAGEPALQITDSKFRHARGPWRRVNGKPTGEFLLASVPLDRNLTDGQKKNVSTVFRLMDPMHPEQAKVVAELPGTGWFSPSFHRNGAQLLLTKYISATESEVWTLDLNTGKAGRLIPVDATLRAVYGGGRYSRNGKGVFLVSDREGEFHELTYFDLQTSKMTSLTRGVPHDVEGASEDDEDDDSSRVLYTRLNVRGKAELRAFDSETFKPVAISGVPEGSVAAVSPRRRSQDVVLTMVSARSPGEIHVLNPRTGQSTQWTKASVSTDTSAFRAQEIITWRSFDGRDISGLINRAPARFTGKRPVMINIHGGPESQARIGFSGRMNYFPEELGITVIQPNVRGSSGFGKTFLELDNGMKREDSVRDIGALLDWIATQPDLDAARVLVMGGSYGGYMSLAVATHYADRIAGSIDVVGISHFVTFLETTESYRRDLRRVEYGDERDPKMREFLHQISPLTNAHKIRKPLFVVQGKNDPRVPYTEAEQIVAKARGNGMPVWYLRAENEGHGFARKENADYYFFSMVRFVEETLLK